MIRSFRFRMLDTVPSDEPTKLLAFVAAVSAEFLRPEMRISGISTTDPSRERTARVTICGIFCPDEGAVAGYGN